MGSNKQPVGVLGGMGPQATVYFMQRVIDAVPSRDDSDHVPLLVDQNSQVPSRIAALIEGGGVDPGPTLAAMAKRLEAAGAVALAMPCNTAHHYAATVASAVGIPFLNMVELSCDRALEVAGKGGRIGLLGSPALERVGVFERPLAARDLRAVYPADLDAALGIIRRIKADGPSPATLAALNAAVADMTVEGIDALCICCTEFSLHGQDIAATVPVFDSLDRLVAATVAASNGSLGTGPSEPATALA